MSTAGIGSRGSRGHSGSDKLSQNDGATGRPKYVADLAMMHRLIKKGPRNAGEGMRLGSL